MRNRDFIVAVTTTAPRLTTVRFDVPGGDRGVLTTRDDGETHRRDLEATLAAKRAEQLQIDFAAVDALTISYVDAFLGRFLTEHTAAQREPVLVMLSGLTEDTASEIDAVLERRKLVAAAIVDAKPTLLGADAYLRSTYLQAVALKRFNANDIAETLGVTLQNANNRLKRLVAMGALSRRRSDPAAGGREYCYEVYDGASDCQ